MNKSAVVIGGGISGIASALELANSGVRVYLIEQEAAIGGQAASLCCKATEVCSKCSVCLVPQKLKEVTKHPQISFLTNSTVSAINGEPGNFRVEIRQKPQYISPEKCIACGMCVETCPTETKAIYPSSPEATPYYYAIDETQCLRLKGEECNRCQEICPTGAIDFERKPQNQELNVGTIIVATGFDVFNAQELGPLGYGQYPNVLTGFDLEKIFKNRGSLEFPTNGKQAKKVAFIQCVGSRNESHGYCSQICCKYAMRLARLIKYQEPDAEVTIFYIDLQTAGKGFAQFYKECQDSIRFIRGVPVEILQTPSGELELKFENISEGKVERETFNFVILSVGMVPRKDSWDLARVLGINQGDYGFFNANGSLDSVETNVKGIFLAGTCQGPRDIPDSIAHGVAAAERAMKVIGKCK